MLVWHKHTEWPGKADSVYSATLFVIQLILLMDALAGLCGPEPVRATAACKVEKAGV